MRTRVLICVALATIAGVALVAATVQSERIKAPEVIAGLAIEMIGIMITVGFVDLLIDRDRTHARAKALAWEVIHAADYAVWVWQGGSRRFDHDEMLALIGLIDETDPRPKATENLLLGLGDRCQNILGTQDPAVSIDSLLYSGLQELAHLSYLDDSSEMNNKFKAPLQKGVPKLLQALLIQSSTSIQNTRRYKERRDPSLGGQEVRSTSSYLANGQNHH